MDKLTLQQAALKLGISESAVRKRYERGTLKGDKGEDGRIYVVLDTMETSGRTGDDPMVEELRRQNEYLRQQLDVRTEELRENRRLLAGLIERIPELEAPTSPDRPPDVPESAEPRPDRVGTPQEPETATQRPWWRRMFGG